MYGRKLINPFSAIIDLKSAFYEKSQFFPRTKQIFTNFVDCISRYFPIFEDYHRIFSKITIK